MSEVIGNVSFLDGNAVAVSADGTERELALGDAIMSDDVVRTVEGSRIEITLASGEAVALSGSDSWAASSAGVEVAGAEQGAGDVIGTVSSVAGQVVAVAADGSERVLMPGDAIYADEVIRTGPDAQIEIAMNVGGPVVLEGGQSWLATSDTYTPADQFDTSEAVADTGSFGDVDAIQAAILAGQDPTQIGEATAAGAPAAGATGGDGNDGGADFVTLSRTGGEIDPTAGYDTIGIASSFEQPVSEELAPLTSAVLTLGNVTVLEGSEMATVSASVDSAVTGTPLVITLSNGATITIPVGQTSGTSTPFSVQGDDPYVDGESYGVSVSGTSGGEFDSLDTSDTGTVTVNDTIDTTYVSIYAENVNEDEAGVTFTATLTNPSQGITTIETNMGTIVIGDGESSGTLVIDTQDSDVYQDPDSLTVTITGASGGNFEDLQIDPEGGSATVDIYDTIDTTTVTLDDVTVSEDGTITYTASVDNAPQGDLTITLNNGVVITILDGQTNGSSDPQPAQGEDPYVDADSFNVSIASTSGGNYEDLDT
ncbi:retention module-containing protein, partial [Marinobacterium lacunae]|uniref:retention module-containing protein n=1 Tax=Marinobacterium lacunae TaxID=1232683 RepID=UPI00056B7707